MAGDSGHGPIDTSDIPELDDDFFRQAELRLPAKQTVTIRLDADVLAWFKDQASGYQTRINQLLRQQALFRSFSRLLSIP